MTLDKARRNLNDFAWNIALPSEIEDSIKAVDEHCSKYRWHDLQKKILMIYRLRFYVCLCKLNPILSI